MSSDSRDEGKERHRTAIATLLTQALAQHREGRLADAARSYQEILEKEPRHIDALHLLGVVHLQNGMPELSRECISKSLEIRPDFAPALSNLGAALRALKRYDEALRSYDRALALNPRHAATLANRGTLLNDLDRREEAVACLDQALAMDSRQPEALYQRGCALLALARCAEALASLDGALALRPEYPDALNNRGIALGELNRHEEAIAAFRQALSLSPDDPRLYNNLGSALHALNRHEEAIASFDRALALNAAYPDAAVNRGLALWQLGRHAAAVAEYERVLALAPAHVEAHWNLGLAQLCLGNLARGWQEHEWRWRRRQAGAPHASDSQRLSRDTDLTGKRVLLWAEQGFGDTIQFCRYASVLVKAGAGVVVEVQRELAPLVRTLPGVSVIARGEPVPAHDYQCPLLSLPLVLNTQLATIPSDTPYLIADRDKVIEWRKLLGEAGGPRIGIVCSGNPAHSNDRNRSMPLARYAPLVETGAHIFFLQDRCSADDEACLHATPRIVDLRGHLTDFSETAAAMTCMDLVISVDTAAVHLAGALGRRCWALLPFAPDWRWQLERDDSPWYPSLRLFRQAERGDWESVIARIVQAVAAKDWLE